MGFWLFEHIRTKIFQGKGVSFLPNLQEHIRSTTIEVEKILIWVEKDHTNLQAYKDTKIYLVDAIE